MSSASVTFSDRLFSDLRNLVRSARQRVAVAVNSEAISLYWQVGCRIKKHILKGGRGAYGEQTVKKCAAFLTGEFGSGWGFRTVQHCVRVAYTFTEAEIVYALRTQLSWTHVRALMGIDDELKRMFYLEMAAHEHCAAKYIARHPFFLVNFSPHARIRCVPRPPKDFTLA